MIAIERAVAETPRRNRKYPWHEMQVGDSFLAPCDDIRTISSAACWAQHRTGFRFRCRTTSKGVRVWRIA